MFDDKGFGVDFQDIPLDKINFIFGKNSHKDMGVFVGIGADALPFGDTPHILFQDNIFDFRMMGEDDQFDFNILIVKAVNCQGEADDIEDGIQGCRHREENGADQIEDGIEGCLKSTDRELSVTGCDKDPKQIQTAGTSAIGQDHAAADASDHTADHQAGKFVIQDWSLWYRNQGHENGLDKNGKEGSNQHLFLHGFPCQNEEGNVQTQIDHTGKGF